MVERFQNSDNEKLMMNYLLGELSEAERSQIEERFFADDDYFAEMLAVEDDLIEKYFRGELSSNEFAKFESHFLASPERREHVNLANKINRSVKNFPAEPVSQTKTQITNSNNLRRIFDYIFLSAPGRSLAVAFAALIIICGAAWFWWQRNLLNTEISRLEQESAALRQQKEESERQINDTRQQSQKLAGELQNERTLRTESEEQTVELQRENERLKRLQRENERVEQPKSNPSQPPSTIITFLLTTGLTRDLGEEKTLRFPPGAQTVIFNLSLQQDEYPNYQVSLQTAEGREVWRRDEIKARRSRSGLVLAFPVPARRLREGVYILTLNGKTADKPELINQYAFSVVNK